ncbi:hypothetical protein [Halomonas alkalisoli]|uniref:hypothetical protein n=1 Tax=Halomonas alkalisoli TaxID=2907158 RepID=UPI001F390B74|nr:hypothetical protein [Halomonas alkalisoli]MCE9681950.1 hypothetical protein [Halomonas alkalisoli]
MRHERLANIASGVNGIAQLVQEDLKRQADANGQPFLNQYRLGCLMSALEELATQADIMSEEMADDREGRS